MTSQPLTTALPPATPILDLGPALGSYSSSASFTQFAQNALVTDGTDKILGLQVRIVSGSATLGIVENNVLKTQGAIGNIGYDYSTVTKVLRLTDNTTNGTATASEFQTVLRTMGISGATGSVNISANLGRPIFSLENGHYYEFVPFTSGSSLNWVESRGVAESKSFLGLSGYLVSITTQSENDFLTNSFATKGWIGGEATDIVTGTGPIPITIRTWSWVGKNSPENGKSFWTGNSAGTSNGTAIGYANWVSGEPNNFTPGEPYAHFLTNGKWNDHTLTGPGGADPVRQPDGYWVEYSTLSGNADTLAATRDTILLTPGITGPSALDLAFYDPASGKVSFAFVGANNTIGSEGLTSDTPSLTINPATPYAGSTTWGLVSAKLDVDNDGLKDTIFINKTDGSVSVVFGAVLTGTTNRASAARGFAFVTGVGGDVLRPLPSSWEIDFASSKIGAGGTPGLFWRNSITGLTAIWTLSAPTGGNTATARILETANVTGNSGWKALGDGEFDQNVATREIFWLNSKTNEVVTWTMGSDRTTFSWKYAAPERVVPTGWNVSAIGNISGVSGLNDNVIWQNGTTVLSWDMKGGALSSISFGGLGYGVITITAADRIKAIADIDGDNVLDLIGQNDGNGTIASYALTSGFALKNTSSPRTQYASNNVAGYRPAKGGLNGSQLELVNVAQYDAPKLNTMFLMPIFQGVIR